ncbi:unnamed protein product [Bursaphelenchus okinawaensis]|uniref:Pre-rRNA-processing protein TSR2 homolog n=1 Tax=Bursaphelenchus okinawaensis TaxID=465554 RepID=A0A811KS50_9BILA|nr:unnamed protein product [Bursaphelenchus okinawaensis]CAG9112468.1 unnamed protein product [Bursaphelenchus okinawaensis]
MNRVQAKPYLEGLVKRVLSSWTGYQLALVNQSAGGETKNMDIMLHNELTLLLLETKDLDKFVIEDWLEDGFNEVFNLVLEDGSVAEMSDLLARGAQLILDGKIDQVESVLARLPNENTVNQAKAQSKTVEDPEASGDSGDDDQEMEVEESSSKVRQPKTQTDEDGWTTILKK